MLQVQAVLKRKEEEDQQMQQLIQALQASLEKEKLKVKDLQKQVMLIFYLLTKWFKVILKVYWHEIGVL